MRIPKRYGMSRIENCPFCDKKATTENNQGVPVCTYHKNKNLADLKCICGEWLDVRKGKYGTYFNCINCGNISFNKGIEVNPQIKNPSVEITKNKQTPIKQGYKVEKQTKKETTIRSDELDLM